jgi:hypothetical protein
MDEHMLGEHVRSLDVVDETAQDTNSPILNSDPVISQPPVFAALIQQTPVGDGTVTKVVPMDATVVQDAPLDKTILYKDSVGETIAHEFPTDEAIIPEVPLGVNIGSLAALLSQEESEQLRKRWNEIQGKFVDDPRSAVQQADTLVSDVVEKITQMFAAEHSSLEGQWKQGKDVSTEDLRQALQHYRSFFNRLVV